MPHEGVLGNLVLLLVVHFFGEVCDFWIFGHKGFRFQRIKFRKLRVLCRACEV